MSNKPKDVSLAKALELAEPLVNKGCNVYQKFTCSLCNSRQTIEEPNKFYNVAKCELCGHISNIMETGCGLIVSGPPEIILKNLLEK